MNDVKQLTTASSLQKQPREVFLEILQVSQENICVSIFK